MKMHKKNAEKIILGVIAGIILIIVLVFLVFGPNARRISSLRAKIREGKNRVQKAEKEVAKLNQVESSLQRRRNQIREYEAELPGFADDWFLGILNQIAETTGVNFDKRERKGYTIQVGDYRMLELDLELKTGYHKLGEFINQLERSSHFISVRGLSIIGDESDIARHKIKITVGAFVAMPREGKE